ncbi:hypothetical protein P3W45_001257 [Vairimorpha bombi]|jgi:GTPase SAR1 family protein
MIDVDMDEVGKVEYENYKILFLGFQNSGKSTVHNIIFNDARDKYKKNEYTLDINLADRIEIWDLPGAEWLRRHWKSLYFDTNGIIWIIDLSKDDHVIMFKWMKKAASHEDLKNTIWLVLLHKRDTCTQEKVDLIRNEVPKALPGKVHKLYVTSLTRRKRIKKAYNWLITEIVKADMKSAKK